MDKLSLETVGRHYTPEAMLEVRRRTRLAIHAIAARIEPAMTERDGLEVAKEVLREHGLSRGWHKTYVRFGHNTLLEYGEPSDPNVVLGSDDIFFIDIGPLHANVEGDGGETFTTGSDPDMRRACRDVLTLWHQAYEAWREAQLTGRELYEFATREATEMGWDLNLRRMSGHRIGDYPHPHRYEGLLSEVDIIPSPYVWVLEMHIRHPERPFGAFYEDLMTLVPY